MPGCALWPFGGLDHPDPAKNLGGAAAQILARAVRYDTVNPPGNEAGVANYLVRVLKSEGVDARVIKTPRRGGRAKRAAAWARLRGDGSKRPLVLLSHLDVVPASPKEWAVDPFEGVVVGGFVVGRGALDAKGVSVVHLLTLVELARRDKPLSRDVIFLATPDEESGGRDGAGYFVREHRALLYDAEFLLTEGGSIAVGEGDASPIWGVTVTEKSPCWLRVIARGAPAHSSTAPPVTSVTRLLDALQRIRAIETEIRVVPEVERMFAALAPLAPPEDRAGMANLGRYLELDPEFRKRFLSVPGRNALVRNTLSITKLQGSQLTNVIPGEAAADLDVRLLPGEHCKDFEHRVQAAIRDPGISVDPILSFTTSSSPVNTELFRAIRDVAAEVDPGAPVVPRVIAGFTDAHYFRDLGIASYGFVPRWLPPSETRGIHGQNERISVRNLERGVETLVKIVERLAEGR